MIFRHNSLLGIAFLLCLVLTGYVWICAGVSGVYREEFDGDLSEDYWDVKAEGNASYEIANGQIDMTSPDVSDALLIYWIGGDITAEDFSVEIEASIGPTADGAGPIAFIKKILSPTVNTIMNVEWKTCFWVGKVANGGWYINDDSWKRTTATGPEREGIWKAEIIGDTIRAYFNGEEVVTYDKVQEDRYYCFGRMSLLPIMWAL